LISPGGLDEGDGLSIRGEYAFSFLIERRADKGMFDIDDLRDCVREREAK
jgi:hypothetical protein